MLFLYHYEYVEVKMLSITIFCLIVAGKIKDVSLLLLIFGHSTIWLFLNAYYSFVQIKYLIDKKRSNPHYGRDQWIEDMNPINSRSLMSIWNHFYFDIFYIAIYIEYFTWWLNQIEKEDK